MASARGWAEAIEFRKADRLSEYGRVVDLASSSIIVFFLSWTHCGDYFLGRNVLDGSKEVRMCCCKCRKQAPKEEAVDCRPFFSNAFNIRIRKATASFMTQRRILRVSWATEWRECVEEAEEFSSLCRAGNVMLVSWKRVRERHLKLKNRDCSIAFQKFTPPPAVYTISTCLTWSNQKLLATE